MEKSEKILTEISNLCGLDFLWKNIIGGKDECGFSLEHTFHCCQFCRKVKENKSRLKLCIENDKTLLPRQAREKQMPFLHRCHAGVLELVIPLFIEKQGLEVVLLGVFKENEKEICPYPELRQLYSSVPLKEDCRLDSALEIFPNLCRMILDRREAMNLQNLVKKISDHRILQTMIHLERNLADKVSAGQLASKVFLSESRFLHLFKEQTGCSLSEYLTKKRLAKAEELLKYTDLPIRTLMDKCGIRDQSHFGAMFRKQTGYTPFVYRKKFGRKADIIAWLNGQK